MIADICRVESAKGLAEASDVALRARRAPAAADIGSATNLTNLSTTARIRCFGELAAKPLDWLQTDKDAAVAHRRWMMAAGGYDRLLRQLPEQTSGEAEIHVLDTARRWTPLFTDGLFACGR